MKFAYKDRKILPGVFDVIRSSPRLRRQLLPGTGDAGPYEVLDYRETLLLADVGGMHASFLRTQRVQFLRSGVAAVMDWYSGDGVLGGYLHTAGPLGDSFRDGDRRYLVVGLPRRMAVGECLEFGVERSVIAGFTGAEEWVEGALDHPARRIERRVVFPKDRPVERAALHAEGLQVNLPIRYTPDGRTVVRFEAWRPKRGVSYTMRWRW